MPDRNPALESMVAKAESLYTLPAVAMEVVRLTDSEQVDAQALKQCIERDPALAAKLLKVVNSSLFGLNGKVENLTQAIALLGTRPLKLLALGFSLPDALLDDLDVEQLEHYWRGAVTRAVAARQLAETQWQMPGDDAFLVALLQDIGMLVLLQQLGTPYARFLAQVRTHRQRVVEFEQSSLGFDHRQLTVALLRTWQLPDKYAAAILAAVPRPCTDHDAEVHSIRQVLRLANLVAELVDEHRLQVLPDLLELGKQYCDMDKDDLRKLVAELQPQVDGLAGVLDVRLTETETYAVVLEDAHRQLAQVAEQAAGMLLQTDEQVCEQLLTDARDLEQALHDFAQRPSAAEPAARISPLAGELRANAHGPHAQAANPYTTQVDVDERLATSVATAAADCRQQRHPLTLLLAEMATDDHVSLAIAGGDAMDRAVEQLLADTRLPRPHLIRLTTTSFVLLLPGVERREAVAMAQQLARSLTGGSGDSPPVGGPVQCKAGVASIAAIPKGFEPERLLAAAKGCLSAAHASGGSAVKSIEVY